MYERVFNMTTIKFCVPTTFESSFLERINGLNEKYRDTGSRVYEIYGSFKFSILGTGWPATILPHVDEDRFAQHVEEAHAYGIRFAYTLNPVCMGLAEYMEEGRAALNDLLRKLLEFKVDTLIIAIPYLIEYVAKNFPQFEINASSLCYIDSLNRALIYESLGATRLTLSEDLNKSFKLLKLIREKCKAKLEIIANNGCLLRCPFRTYHNTITAHVSQCPIDDPIGFTYKPYPFMRCTLKRLSDHKEILKAPWIRPEDIKYYAQIGIDYIKIAGRGLPADDLLKLIEAYLAGRYDGDIYALIDNSYIHFCWNMFDLSEEPLPLLRISIDNRSLDGWYEYFIKNDPPCIIGCGDCNYCGEIAKRVVKTDLEIEKKYIERIKRMIDKITSIKPPIVIRQTEEGRVVTYI
ncbi:MAG: U32 family peptidase [Candidatus Bathyarchaeia archaeon]|nr:U32 family peptidase [Candidatus Bathyarchaeota archaeon]